MGKLYEGCILTITKVIHSKKSNNEKMMNDNNNHDNDPNQGTIIVMLIVSLRRGEILRLLSLSGMVRRAVGVSILDVTVKYVPQKKANPGEGLSHLVSTMEEEPCGERWRDLAPVPRLQEDEREAVGNNWRWKFYFCCCVFLSIKHVF